MENINNLDLNLLVIFDAVLAEGNVSRAALRLNMAQPTVSNAINRLRKLTGDPLFVRTGRGMEPTPYAEKIAQPIRTAIAMIRTSLQAPRLFDPASSTRSFTLYLTDLGESYFLPRLLSFLRTEAPNVKIMTLPMPDTNPQSALESGEIDLAIGNLGNFKAGFYQQRLFREHYICIVGPKFPLTKTKMSLKQFSQASHAVVLPAGTSHKTVEEALLKLGLQERIMLRVQNFLALPAIVERSDLIAIVPHSVAAQLASDRVLRLVKLPIRLPEFDVKQIWHERFHSDSGNQWLRSQVARMFHGSP